MPDQTVSLDWMNVLTLVLGTGFFTAFIGWGKDWITDKLSRKRDATYLALRVAVILEGFAIQCAEVISDQQLYAQSDGSAGATHGKIPSMAEYPKDICWNTLDTSLAARALTLRNEIALSQGKINFWYDVDFLCVPSACDQECGKCGYRAWSIAVDLRKKYSLPMFNPKQVSWDIEKTLFKEHNRAIAQNEKDLNQGE